MPTHVVKSGWGAGVAIAHAWKLLARLFAVVALLAFAMPYAIAMADDKGVPQSSTQGASAAPALAAVPGARAAKNPFIIPIQGPIDEWTARSVVRRIREAELAGADAIVFDLDTPGGEMQAMLVISGAIKKSSVKTVAWVNPNAYSAGAVIALACGEIVASDSAALGDALPIDVMRMLQGKGMSDREAEKFLGPIMADVVDSARKNGRDEIMVQGMVRRGVELWLIENSATGQRYFVTEDQYKAAVGAAPVRGSPMVPSVTGPVSGRTGSPPAGMPTGDVAKAPGPQSEPTRYIPGAPNVSPELAKEVDQELALRGRVTARPDFAAPEHAAKYKPIEYVSDGYGALTFRTSELIRYQIAAERVRSEADLKAFFGAAKTTTLSESWSEQLARFLSLMPVKGLLVAVFLIAMFVEMTHPGLMLPGAIAMLALAALVVPPMLVNMSAWWVPLAILAGIVLIAVELFLFPGTLVAGILGVILLFGGLMGAVLGGGSGFSVIGSGEDGLYAVATLLLAAVAAAGGSWLIGRHLPKVPVFNRLVLKNDDPDAESAGPSLAATLAASTPLKRGQVGRTITPLRPAGRAQFADQMYDVVADVGFIATDRAVRVVSSDAFRTVVEPVEDTTER